MCICIVNIRNNLIDRKIISGKVICMNELKLLNTKESAKVEQNWMSKQELMDIFKCSKDSLERIVAALSGRTGAATQICYKLIRKSINHSNSYIRMLLW